MALRPRCHLFVDESGRIYVLDRQAAEIRVFDHDGEFVRTFGRPGGGPGELASPSAVLIGAADTVFIPGAAKYDVFDREGRFLGVIATPDRFQPMQADAEHVYGVSRDDLGAQRVARLRVRR